MYRDQTRIRKTPQDTQFWRNANNLKKAGHETIVHALAWEYPEIYSYLLKLFEENVPLERITILLWRDYHRQMSIFRKAKLGSFTPTSLRNFREKYFKINNLPNPQFIRKEKQDELNNLAITRFEIEAELNALKPIEERVCRTQEGNKLRDKYYKIIKKMAELEIQLFHSTRVLEKSVTS